MPARERQSPIGGCRPAVRLWRRLRPGARTGAALLATIWLVSGVAGLVAPRNASASARSGAERTHPQGQRPAGRRHTANLPGPVRAIPEGLNASAYTTRKVVALTFDDGPSTYTPAILKILRHFEVPATFFAVGTYVPIYPQYLRQAIRQGDEIGNHTYSHLDLQNLSTPDVVAQLEQNQAAIRTATGVVPHWFRPPYGDVDDRIVQIAESLNLHPIIWSVDPADWSLPGVKSIVANVLDYTQPGSVVIMHDGGGDRSETVKALPTIIEDLKHEQYRFGTLDELFGLRRLPPCVKEARRLFGRDGFAATPVDPIYRKWASLLCYGQDLGPATGAEHRLSNADHAQDFRDTAHELQLGPDGRVTVRIMWGWGAAVFEKENVAARFGTPITHSWFARYLQGTNEGPAVSKPFKQGKILAQHFLRGWAVQEPDGTVMWTRTFKPAKKKT